MHRNFVFLSFLCLVALYALYYTGSTALDLYRYARLHETAEIKDISWAIRSYGEDAYSPQAEYHFDYQGQTFSGRTIWSERYLNQWAATEAIHRMDTAKVWFNPSDPTQSSMEKLFPLKSLIYMIMLWGLIAYFLFLGKRVATYLG